MQIKTTVRYHLTPVIMAIIYKTRNNKFCKDIGKKEPLYPAGGNVNWYSLHGNSVKVPQKLVYHMTQQSLLQACTPQI